MAERTLVFRSGDPSNEHPSSSIPTNYFKASPLSRWLGSPFASAAAVTTFTHPTEEEEETGRCPLLNVPCRNNTDFRGSNDDIQASIPEWPYYSSTFSTRKAFSRARRMRRRRRRKRRDVNQT